MTIDIATAFINDTDPTVISNGLRMLANIDNPAAEEYLINAVFNDLEIISKVGIDVLLYRNPWLKLKPHKEIPAPSKINNLKETKQYKIISDTLNKYFVDKNEEIIQNKLKNFETMPGIVPLLIKCLETKNYSKSIKHIERAVNLYGEHSTSKQIIFCPTYSCNINCSYCYAKDWKKSFKEEMSKEELIKFLNLLKKQNYNHILLGGGEPTVYTYFIELLKKAKELDINIILTSNTFYSEKIQEYISPEYVQFLVAHYDQDYMQNNKVLKQKFISNIKTAKDNKLEIILRYTLTKKSNSEEWQQLILLAKDNNIDTINYAFAFKNINNDNEFVDLEFYKSKKFEKNYFNFINDCKQSNIKLRLSKPIPLCIFSNDTLRNLILTDVVRSSCAAFLRNYTQNITVNPDFSTFPCNAIFKRGPNFTDFNDIKLLGEHYKNEIDQLLYKPYIKECLDCFFYYKGFCHGTCLVNKV